MTDEPELKAETSDSDTSPPLPLVREALCLLPAYRGQDYAQAVVEGGFLRLDLREATMDVALQIDLCRRLGVKPTLDKDHDYKMKMFIVEKGYLIEKIGIFVLGYWTPEGLRLRSRFRGVSDSCSQYSKKYPPPAEYLAAKKKQWEERKKTLADDASFLGPLGCICIDYDPTFPDTSVKTLPLDGEADDLRD